VEDGGVGQDDRQRERETHREGETGTCWTSFFLHYEIPLTCVYSI